MSDNQQAQTKTDPPEAAQTVKDALVERVPKSELQA